MTYYYVGAMFPDGISCSYNSGKKRTDGGGYENRINASSPEEALEVFKKWLEKNPNPFSDAAPEHYILTWDGGHQIVAASPVQGRPLGLKIPLVFR